ncbi:cell envelope integrity protein TolA [Idiomarina seosinensis]|uniref:cell envelope integrity protein TolA n=1 Tax=Idiomarina seosinensis TaxID=281739 RepID=UPI001F53E3C6|nr:cell envelope integrity protein TolA [Idiomarina seosinensis]
MAKKVTGTESLTLPLIYSVGIHLAIAGVLLISFEFTPNEPESMEVSLSESEFNEQPDEVVQAVSVDKAAVQQQVDRIKAQQEAERQAEQQRIAELERKAEAARKAREREEQRREEIQRQQQQQQQEATKARQAAEEAKREAEKLAEQRRKAEQAAREAEQRRKAAEEAERRAEEERKRREAERKRLEEERRKAAEREAQLQKEMEAERERRQAARRQQMLSEIEKYQALIQQTIQRNWNVDESMSGKSCELTISLAPSGFVKNVSTGAGDPAVCRSAENAVLKATTLPVSEDPEIFEQMSTIKLTVKPQL